MTTQLEVACEALAQIGTRSTITALDDGSAEATYINLLYGPIRDFLLVDGDYDWSMTSATLVELVTSSFPYAVSYPYPPDALRIRQLVPAAPAALDPHPVEWVVKNSGGVRVICASEKAPFAFYTMAAAEGVWDAMFRQSFVRMLASALSFALENRIEASKVKLDEALGFAGIGKLRDI